MDRVKMLIMEAFTMHEAYRKREVSLETYSLFFRTKEMLMIQGIFLMSFLFFFAFIFGMPLFMVLGASVLLIYGMWLQSLAKNMLQIMLYAFLWAISSFAVTVLIAVWLVKIGVL